MSLHCCTVLTAAEERWKGGADSQSWPQGSEAGKMCLQSVVQYSLLQQEGGGGCKPMVMTWPISDKTDMSTMLYSTYCNSRKVEGGMVMTSQISDKTRHVYNVVQYLLQQQEGGGGHGHDLADQWQDRHVYNVVQYLLQQQEGGGGLQTHGHDLTDQWQERRPWVQQLHARVLLDVGKEQLQQVHLQGHRLLHTNETGTEGLTSTQWQAGAINNKRSSTTSLMFPSLFLYLNIPQHYSLNSLRGPAGFHL